LAESTLLAALLANESGGRNINNTTQGTSSGQAQGYFQITTGTWDEFGGQKYAPNPQAASYAEQAAIASQIPLRRWDSSTIARMRATGKQFDISKTFGQNLAANGESFSDFNPGTRQFAASKGSGTAPAPITAAGQAQAPQTAAPPSMGSMIGQALGGMASPGGGGGGGMNSAMMAQAAPAAPGPQMAFRAAADDAAQASQLTAGGPPGSGAPGQGAGGMTGLLGLMADPNAQSQLQLPTDVPMTGMSGLLYGGGAGLGIRRPAVTRLT
jgi:hypothetical protein